MPSETHVQSICQELTLRPGEGGPVEKGGGRIGPRTCVSGIWFEPDSAVSAALSPSQSQTSSWASALWSPGGVYGRGMGVSKLSNTFLNNQWAKREIKNILKQIKIEIKHTKIYGA